MRTEWYWPEVEGVLKGQEDRMRKLAAKSRSKAGRKFLQENARLLRDVRKFVDENWILFSKALESRAVKLKGEQ